MISRRVKGWACVLMVAGATSVAAQTRATTGDFRALAVDESGLPLPDVRLVLANIETGAERTVATGADGRAAAPALPVGPYSLHADADRFRPVVVDNVTIQLGTVSELRITMRLASLAETVDVSAPVPLLDARRSVVSTTISEQQ
ncbi:MAG TPA: carboxypeptidase-like regulatory domain-containing protein, partial [Vicinamibacterales bacterium]|nr:carboxypeptidase-like regulatory domain-containing protein [Vicinamibacterales bacterium]